MIVYSFSAAYTLPGSTYFPLILYCFMFREESPSYHLQSQRGAVEINSGIPPSFYSCRPMPFSSGSLSKIIRFPASQLKVPSQYLKTNGALQH